MQSSLNSEDEDFCSYKLISFTEKHSELVENGIENGVSKETVENKTSISFLDEDISKWISSRDNRKEIIENISDQSNFLSQYPDCVVSNENLVDYQKSLVENNPKLESNQMALDWLTMGMNVELLNQYEAQFKYEYELYSKLISNYIETGNFELVRLEDNSGLFGRFGYLDVLLYKDDTIFTMGLSSSDQEFSKNAIENGFIRRYEGVIVDSLGVMKDIVMNLERDEVQEGKFFDKILNYFSSENLEEINLDSDRLVNFNSSVLKDPEFTLFIDYIYSSETDNFNLKYTNKILTGQFEGTLNGETYVCKVYLEIKDADEITLQIPSVFSKDSKVYVDNFIPYILDQGYLGNFWEGYVCNEEVIVAPTNAGYMGSGKIENNYFMLPIVIFINHIDSIIFDFH